MKFYTIQAKIIAGATKLFLGSGNSEPLYSVDTEHRMSVSVFVGVTEAVGSTVAGEALMSTQTPVLMEVDANRFYRWTSVHGEFQLLMCLCGFVLRWVIMRVEPNRGQENSRVMGGG